MTHLQTFIVQKAMAQALPQNNLHLMAALLFLADHVHLASDDELQDAFHALLMGIQAIGNETSRRASIGRE